MKRSYKQANFQMNTEKPSQYKSDDVVEGKSPDGSEEFVAFYGLGNPFSNFYPAKFVLNEKKFNCNEQYFHYMKAVLFKDEESQQEILSSESPRKQKSLGRMVKNFSGDVWEEECTKIMKDACLAKFGQNADLKAILLDNGEKTLVEAAPRDNKWGIGFSKNNPNCFIRSKWRGKNLLGTTLMEVRTILRETDTASSSSEPQ